MKNQIIKKSWVLALALFAAVGCSDDNPSPVDPGPEPEPTVEGSFLVAVKSPASTSTEEVTYLVPAATLEDPNASITIKGAGYEFSNTFTHWLANGYQGLVGLKYGQGKAHVGQRFTINAAGTADVVGAQFEILNGFVTAGVVDNVIYTIMSGGRSSDPTLATFNRIPMSAGIPDYDYFSVNKFTGYEGKNAQLIGLVDAGGGSFYTGLDLSAEGVDDVVVAKINANNLTTEAVYSDTRLSFSGGRRQSGRHSQIGLAGNGDVYVFSGNYLGTKKAGALVIKKGAAGFDKDYYWDIEEAAGGYRFRKVWEIKDDIFLLEFYNDLVAAGTSQTGYPTQYAMVDMSEKKLTWLKNFPSKADIPEDGVKWPYVYNGKAYLGVTTSAESPRFYVVDPETAEAKKGLLVKDASAIESAAFVEKK